MAASGSDRRWPGSRATRLRIERVIEDDHATLRLKGEFDAAQCSQFLAEIDELIAAGVHHVIVDLARVEFVNSTAMAAIIKAEELCKAAGGIVVLSRLSPVVQKIIHGIGVDTVVASFDQHAAAVRHIIRALNQREFAAAAPFGREPILVTMPDETRIRQLGGKRTVVGELVSVDGERVHFHWQGSHYGLTGAQAAQLFFRGSEIAVKFQVKLFKKGYFEVVATIADVRQGDADAIEVVAAFTKISRPDRDALRQYATDMEYLDTQRQKPERETVLPTSRRRRG